MRCTNYGKKNQTYVVPRQKIQKGQENIVSTITSQVFQLGEIVMHKKLINITMTK